MRRTRVLFAILALLSTARSGLAQPPQYAGATDDSPPLERAQRALDRGEWSVAYHALLPLWQRAPTPELAVPLAQAELRLGMARDAAEHFAYALRDLPLNTGNARFFAESGLERAQPFVVSLHVHTRSGAEIFVDGTRVGTAPLVGDVFVDEGGHRVEAKLAGFSTAEESFNALMGTAWVVDLQLRPIVPVPSAPPPGEATPSPSKSRSVVPVIVGSAITAAMIGASAVFTIALGSSSSDHAAMERDAAILDGAGLVAAAATFTYALWPTSAKASRSSTHIAPLVRLGTVGLSFGGSM